MAKHKIAFFETEKWEEEYVKSRLKNAEIKFFSGELNERNAEKVKDYDIIAVFIYSQVNRKVLAKLENVKLIATMSTGYDHINIDLCSERKICVCNVPTYGENTVAEHTFALILALSRKIVQSSVRARAGNFSLEGLRGFDLKGKTIGVVGCGNIGRHVVRIARGFEMNILVSDSRKDEKFRKEMNFKYADLNTLLKNSDIITLHVPLLKETRYMINTASLEKVKKGAILINTSRGGLVDTNALLKALHKGILAGAGLDVLEEESLIKEEKQLLSRQFPIDRQRKVLENHILLRQENVLITPHNAFNSKEALSRILDTTLDNIISFMNNKRANCI